MSAVAVGQGRTPYPVAARQLLRDTLLDAARDELARRSWSQITMADIASAAGVSRQTLYNEFGSRDEYAQALVLRESDRFLDAVEQAVREHLDDPHAALEVAFDLFLTTAGENPLVRILLSDDGSGEVLPLVTTHGKPVVERAAERLAEVILSGWPQVDPRGAGLLAESLVRLAISHLTLPTESSHDTAASVTALLGPYLEVLLGKGSA